MTLLRDRLAYSQHCIPTLFENAGCDFDWYVVDQGSTDGTLEWLETQPYAAMISLKENIGICRALNLLLDGPLEADNYDAIVRVDNDGEVLTPGTLRTVAEAAVERGWILAPRVLGLRLPPAEAEPAPLGDLTVGETVTLGGIFMAMPADLFVDWEFRYNEDFPTYTGDEAICAWWRANGGHCGYLTEYQVNHYERVVEQAERFPAYQARKQAEMSAA